MRSLRWLAPGALLSLAACGSVDRNALDLPPGDAGASVSVDLGASAVDTGTTAPPTDAGTTPTTDAGTTTPPPMDAGTTPPPPVDAGTTPPPVDAGTTPPPVDAGPPPPVDAGTPPPPVDAGDPSCRACTAFAPVTFCPGTGSGACLSYAGCTSEGCATCAAALAGGDNCGSAITISSTGRRRTVVSTCGARNDVSTGCNGRTGPDIVLALRVARRGQVIVRMNVPSGVSVNFGYDVPARACRDENVLRVCESNSTSSSQSLDVTLDAGTYYLYVATSTASTIVVDTTLP